MKQPVEGAGDVWTWTALDSDSKLIISWLVGGRDGEYALAFMDDVKDRLANRVQLTTDCHRAYLNAVEEAFGADIDYAMLISMASRRSTSRQSAASARPFALVRPRRGLKAIPILCTSTSHIERANLTMRMANRRLHASYQCFLKEVRKPCPHGRDLHCLVQLHQNAQDAENDAGNGRWHVAAMDHLCEKMDAVAPKPGKRGP